MGGDAPFFVPDSLCLTEDVKNLFTHGWQKDSEGKKFSAGDLLHKTTKILKGIKICLTLHSWQRYQPTMSWFSEAFWNISSWYRGAKQWQSNKTRLRWVVVFQHLNQSTIGSVYRVPNVCVCKGYMQDRLFSVVENSSTITLTASTRWLLDRQLWLIPGWIYCIPLIDKHSFAFYSDLECAAQNNTIVGIEESQSDQLNWAPMTLLISTTNNQYQKFKGHCAVVKPKSVSHALLLLEYLP